MIIPAILEKNFINFEDKAKKLSFAPLIQIDVMDGEFVPAKSFSEIEKINNLNLPNEWEIHLMVSHPLNELKKWQEVKNFKRILFHIESEDNPQTVIHAIKNAGYEVGIVINPETKITEILPFLNQINVVMFMTVHPGGQNAPFVPEVQEKIISFKNLVDSKEIDLTIAVDGAINKDNIQEIKKWGVNNFCVGGAILRAPDLQKAYEELTNLI
jgi:ribulose-phosphate 3-epimerase